MRTYVRTSRGVRATAFVLSIVACACKNGTADAPSSSAASPSSSSSAASATAPVVPSGSTSAAVAPPAPTASGAAASARTWTFERETPGAAPAGFAFGRTGSGREGKWEILGLGGSSVLAQTDADPTDYRFPVAWATEPALKDLELKVRCKLVGGKIDQACGLVFRLRDANNYYLTRANALENNIRLYTVKDGTRKQIASYGGKVTSSAWHEHAVTAKGDHIEVYWDGAKVLDQHDSTFGDAGQVGVWTKADSVTYFDDLTVRPQS